MYVGQEFAKFDSEKHKSRYYAAEENESPVNLFKPDLKRYPNFKFVDTHYNVKLDRGDCIFLPGYYFYQIAAESEVIATQGHYKPTAITVGLHYDGNSKLTSAYFDAIE